MAVPGAATPRTRLLTDQDPSHTGNNTRCAAVDYVLEYAPHERCK